MKAKTLIIRGTVAQVLAELKRRASQADTACLVGLGALLLASACAQGPRHPASPPRPQPKPYTPERFSHLRWQDQE